MVDQIWYERGAGLTCTVVMALLSNFRLQPLKLLLVAVSVYNTLELWKFDRFAAASRPPVTADKLFIEPRIDAQALQLGVGADQWTHTTVRALVWNPSRSRLYFFATFNPVVSVGLWVGVFGCVGALLVSLLLAGCLYLLLETFDQFYQISLESTQKQAEYAVWEASQAAAATKRSSPHNGGATSSVSNVARIPSNSSTRSSHSSHSAHSQRVKPIFTDNHSPVAATHGGLSGGLPSPISLPNSPNTSANYSANTSGSLSNLSGSSLPRTPSQKSEIIVPRVRNLVLPPQNPRRTSSYRLSTAPLEVPEMAPRRVASMASRDNMRRQFQQAV